MPTSSEGGQHHYRSLAMTQQPSHRSSLAMTQRPMPESPPRYRSRFGAAARRRTRIAARGRAKRRRVSEALEGRKARRGMQEVSDRELGSAGMGRVSEWRRRSTGYGNARLFLLQCPLIGSYCLPTFLIQIILQSSLSDFLGKILLPLRLWNLTQLRARHNTAQFLVVFLVMFLVIRIIRVWFEVRRLQDRYSLKAIPPSFRVILGTP